MKDFNMKIIVAFTIILLSTDCFSQNIETPKIADFKWLTGNWVGDGFGGVSQEAWTEPTANSMIGVYKHYKDGKPTFYEFMTISEMDGKISLKLKHFNPDMTGWEEKADFVEFPLISATPTKIAFKGLIYELVDKDKMEIRLKLKEDGVENTEVFHFERVKN